MSGTGGRVRSWATSMAAAVVAGLGVVLLLAGCFTSVPHLRAVKDQLEHELPGARFEREMSLRLGRLSLGLAKAIVGAVDDEDEVAPILRGLEGVEIVVYRATSLPELDGLTLPHRVESYLKRQGFVQVVHYREADGAAWVYYQPAADSIRGLYVIFVDGEELGLIRLRGRLDRVLAAAIATSQRWSAGEEPL